MSSIPSRCLTVTGMAQASRIARTASATRSGSAIRQAPNCPDCTRSEGQPQLRLISWYPQSSAQRAQRARSSGSLPPICSASGCSWGAKARKRARSPWISAPVVTISVYRRARRLSRRQKKRQCRSDQSMSGAVQKRWLWQWADMRFACKAIKTGILSRIRRNYRSCMRLAWWDSSWVSFCSSSRISARTSLAWGSSTRSARSR